MFGIGWGEMVVIGLVALVVVGPEKLPELARTLGRVYGQLRQAAAEAGQAITDEVDQLKESARLPKQDLTNTLNPALEEIKKNFQPEYLLADNDPPAKAEPDPAQPTSPAETKDDRK